MKNMIASLAVVMLMTQPMAATAWAQSSQDQVATSPAAPAAQAPAEADPDANREICKAQTTTGSRLAKKKVCRTKAEWDEQYRLQRQEAEQMQRGDMANRTPRGG
ncbi:hypothetical protein [Niveispirillum sp. BGYR6]|uniref:hypothetical protein n=1 Tax=Niveispirillum sp. BGYR6 TaxID=2971249 RepID=UPI0022B97315|nr:hypothetical protein [Niveispirillum sp. BGYR6]MDG5495765.1 hypothetical protein [Niveispirillum sp. BGYR6]